MLSGCASNRPRTSRENERSPFGATSLRDCVHTRKMVEPGRYSQRNTAFPRSERKLKFGSLNENGLAGPVPSGSTVYVPLAELMVPMSLPYDCVASVRGAVNSLKFVYAPLAMNGCA